MLRARFGDSLNDIMQHTGSSWTKQAMESATLILLRRRMRVSHQSNERQHLWGMASSTMAASISVTKNDQQYEATFALLEGFISMSALPSLLPGISE